MKTKACTKCGAVKPASSEFFEKVRGSKGARRWYLMGECRECAAKRRHEYHKRPEVKEALRECRRKGLAKVKAWVRAYKETRSCADCGQRFPHYVLDFDHVRFKRYSVSRLTTTHTNLCRIAHEIKHCDVVCANCHRERTWKRRASRGRPTKMARRPFEHLPGCKCHRYSKARGLPQWRAPRTPLRFSSVTDEEWIA